MQNVGVYKKV